MVFFYDLGLIYLSYTMDRIVRVRVTIGKVSHKTRASISKVYVNDESRPQSSIDLSFNSPTMNTSQLRDSLAAAFEISITSETSDTVSEC